MERIKLTSENQKQVINKAMEYLSMGSIVIYPTETCYGIAVDATNQSAVDKLLKYKTHRKDKPISVAVSSKKMAEEYVHINKMAENIYDNFLPGPITVVSRGKGKLAQGIESILGTQGIRIPDHPFVLKLLGEYKKPITSTSANASYKKTPYTINDILNNLSNKQKSLIGLIIDAGRLPKRKPSTIVDTTLENIHILREGSFKLDNPVIYKSYSLKETEKFAHVLCEKIKKSLGKKKVVFMLEGDLGAGKTHFAKYIAKVLKVKDIVVSPTFNLCNEYAGKINGKKIMLYHIDTYRMYDERELEDLKPRDIFSKNNVVIIEWANKIHKYIQKYLDNSVVIEISINAPKEFERVFKYKIKE